MEKLVRQELEQWDSESNVDQPGGSGQSSGASKFISREHYQYK